tara:strand:- start:16363 stop:16656 length:294 start_codon:yes stop_codon:yes gene_type:complete
MKKLLEKIFASFKQDKQQKAPEKISKTQTKSYKNKMLDFRNSGNIVCSEQKVINFIQAKIQKNKNTKKSKEIIEILSRDGCLQRFSVKGKPYVYIKF